MKEMLDKKNVKTLVENDLPEVLVVNLKTKTLEYLDPRNSNVNWEHYIVLSDLWA